MIAQSTIDKIFSVIRVEEIIGEYVQLKKAGTNLKGLSPFRDEKTPSFVVSPSKQIWKDFSTGKGGTAISFLMEIENFTYPEALKYAAKKYSIDVEESAIAQTPEQKAAQGEREQLFKIHEVALDFFIQQLHQTEEGKSVGISYLRERDLRIDIIEKFQLGYSPIQKDAFTRMALERGYGKELLEKSGLSIFNDRNQGIDRFRERIIFPIHSFSGRVLGFGARLLKNNQKVAKYLNSPESEIYHKSHVLYGLNQSKQAISRTDLCLLVEGYMDVISLHQHGVENVVASSGTALSEEQIKLIKRLTENVTILFDSDQAGIKASFRSIDMLLVQGMNVRIVLFPDGHDPDSFARSHSRENLQDYITSNALDFINFKAEVLLKDAANDPIKISDAIKDIVRSVAKVSSPLKQEVYLKEVATRFTLSEQSLFNELAYIKNAERAVKPAKKELRNNLEKVELPENSVDALLVLEEKLIEIMLKYGDLVLVRSEGEEQFQTTVIEEVLSHLEEDGYQMRSTLNSKIIHEIKKGLEENELRKGDFFLKLLDEDLSVKTAGVLIEQHETSDWAKHNIFFKKEKDVVSTLVEEVIIRHKREFIMQMISGLKQGLAAEEDPTTSYKRIVQLNKLKMDIDQMLHRIL